MITPTDILSPESWILFVSLLVLLRLYIHKQWQFLKNLNIPHELPSIFGFGNMLPMFKDPAAFYKDDVRLKKKFGKVYGMFFGLTPRIVVSDPEILKKIYIEEFSSFKERDRNFSGIGGKEMNSSLVSTVGSDWKRSRSTLSATFSTAKLRQMFVLSEQCADKMIAKLKRSSAENDGKFNVEKVFSKVVMDIMCSSAFGVSAYTQDESESRVVTMAQRLVETNFFSHPLVIITVMFPWMGEIFKKLNVSVFSSEILGYFSHMTDVFIQKKAAGDDVSRVDFLKLLLQSEISEEDVRKGAVKGLTRTEIVGNTMIFILAGYSNMSTTLALSAYCIATNKDVQDALIDELQQTIDSLGGLTYDGINEMKYLDMCVKETLRLYDLQGRNSRRCTKDITIKGVHFPAGVHVDIPTYVLQHDEEYWEDPWEYKPERFEDVNKIDPMTYQPFGIGPRNCVGLRYALVQIKLTLCKILQHFRLEVCEETPAPPLELTIKSSIVPKEKVVIKLVERKNDAIIASN